MAIKIGAIFELKDSFSNKLKKLEGNAAKSFKNISRSAKTLKNRLKKDLNLKFKNKISKNHREVGNKKCLLN